jgi:hypothetical protein
LIAAGVGVRIILEGCVLVLGYYRSVKHSWLSELTYHRSLKRESFWLRLRAQLGAISEERTIWLFYLRSGILEPAIAISRGRSSDLTAVLETVGLGSRGKPPPRIKVTLIHVSLSSKGNRRILDIPLVLEASSAA